MDMYVVFSCRDLLEEGRATVPCLAERLTSELITHICVSTCKAVQSLNRILQTQSLTMSANKRQHTWISCASCEGAGSDSGGLDVARDSPTWCGCCLPEDHTLSGMLRNCPLGLIKNQHLTSIGLTLPFPSSPTLTRSLFIFTSFHCFRFSSEISAPVRKSNKGESPENNRGATEVWRRYPGR